MERGIANRIENFDFACEIEDLFARVEQYAKLCYSPKRIEFEFCAFLAAWETTTLPNSEGQRWFQIWQKHCNKLHHGQVGLTLADPVNRPTLSKRWQLLPEETPKAYKSVLGGLRRVFKATLTEYHLENDDGLTTHPAPWAVLRQLIDHSFKTAKAFACPEGLESFLLTLIQVFERSLGQDKSKLVSREQWHAELRRKRSLGPAATRTLADVASADERLKRRQAFPEEERIAILTEMLPSMRQIEREIQSYLSKHSHEENE